MPEAIRIDRDEVKANRPVSLFHLEKVCLGGSGKSGLLAVIDRLFGRTVAAASSLDLYKDEDFPIECYEIDLSSLRGVASGHQRITLVQ